ncbi:MAG TPA: hypothetical protein VGP72_21140 [Planctomycetota bacterium]|jgi:hypothetical protein
MRHAFFALFVLFATLISPLVSSAEKKDDDKPATFPEPAMPDVLALLAKRTADLPDVEPTTKERQEIQRIIRNFSGTAERFRDRNIRDMQSYGRVAYPFIGAAYTQPFELSERIDLLQVLAMPGSPLTAGYFRDAHTMALSQMNVTENTPPAPPPDYPSKRDREQPQGRLNAVRAGADNVLRVEGYMSVAGGPFNALQLLQIYQKRYGSEKTAPLLTDVTRDAARLAATAVDAKRAKGSWTRDDRIMLAEHLIPMLFVENEDLKKLPQDALKKLLPTGYPKFDADAADWIAWWDKVKDSPRAWK